MQSETSSRPTQWIVWGGLVLVIVVIAAAYVVSRLNRMTGETRPALPVYSEVPEFTLTNQLGRAITRSDLKGRVWIADIIFTRCAGPCPRMTRQMAELQTEISADRPVKLVSLTTDPEFDTPAVMNRYAERFGADPERWWFLTGEKSEIVHLAVDGLKLTAQEKDPATRESPADLFIHSTIFVIVDKQGRLRGTFQTYEEEFGEDGQPLPTSDPAAAWEATKARLLSAVEQLLKE